MFYIASIFTVEMCTHESCGFENMIWLPLKSDRGSDIAPHPWCTKCGAVKNISPDRAKRLGYWTDILSRMSRQFKVSQAQKRLVVKELEAYDGFGDIYSMTFSAQQKIFVNVVKKYLNLREQTIYSFL